MQAGDTNLAGELGLIGRRLGVHGSAPELGFKIGPGRRVRRLRRISSYEKRQCRPMWTLINFTGPGIW